MSSATPSWYSKIGAQRDWAWRGWQVRYTYIRSTAAATNPPLLFLHGFGSALGQWRYNLHPLSESHTVYAMDLLGFGASEKAPAEYGVTLWMEQVYDFWRTWIRTPVILVGHSLGALVAIATAAAYPEMVGGLILLTIPASRQEVLPAKLQPLVGSLESFFASPLLLRPLFQLITRKPGIIRSVLKKIYVNPEVVNEELVALFTTPPLDRGAAGVFCRLSKARTRRDFAPNVKDLLPQITSPTLVLWGQQDKVIPIAWGRQLTEHSPHLKLVEIEDAGHCPYDEHPERVNQEIAHWLKKYGSGECSYA
ncbi:alpha/beta fold hydrolase [Desertifilum sp. FACHB-1129]|uniref:Alpha/beta hydrolase n=2 Tax=Cyanophyceae TaxID=3028117 RepID=A0A1E5QKI7_9CYAN|nr:MULTISPECIES: alpha/beta fold hydrolase [Cyanophyceae]MCD8488902.1 alpha/beta fold hydrolase [Desertifilum sp.]MDA0211081.1 alpha/beta fold hydrolase [Cyanobacteria bacterium FC1]MBD2314183.1 alpha/beta fold hydrolase [Desertifilum sp. FACHB-1129]MBD2320148.1 alpha/beta fold hydrolase [Desertifilum sp. FACHB-866]MBD2330276.1 alpha/beta fold hydrolase [Desertifilum sp. FACHB-868]